jgi:hypothetical protein
MVGGVFYSLKTYMGQPRYAPNLSARLYGHPLRLVKGLLSEAEGLSVVPNELY